LVQGHVVALERTCEIIADQDGVQPSDGAVQNWIMKAGQFLADDYAANQQSILAAGGSHFDERGRRIGGPLNWLHVAATETAGYYTVHGKRGQEAMAAVGSLPQCQGHAVHDHWKASWSYPQCSHSLCHAHHRRALRYCEEVTGHFGPGELRRLLVAGKAAVAEARAAGQTAVEPARGQELRACYDQQVQNGLTACPVRLPAPGQKGRVKHQEATTLVLRLRDYKTQVWRFLTDWRVPFDNNRAERRVRPAKVKLKVTGGFRAFGGSTAFCILRSVWETNKLNGINPFDTLRLVFEGR
jgi:transposase